jgi:heme A synthase
VGESVKNGPEDGREEIMRPSSSPLRERDDGILMPLLIIWRWLNRHREICAGGIMVLLGLGIALKGATYRAGSLMHMGPGFLPTALGVILLLLGITIAVPGIIAAAAASPSAGEHGADNILPERPQWFAWLCILMSPVCFIFFGRYFGMAPATFSCVMVAALGDKDATWRGTIILATIVTVFGVGLFSYFLQVPMPIFTWRGGL